MNTIYNKIGILAAASALLLSAGCMQLELNDPAMDENIVFGASTEYENDAVETRTEYSGQILGSTTKYERINWVSGQDKVRVYCNEALNVDAHYLDYTIGTVSTQSEKSQATVTGASGVFKWNNNITDHYFYALYPSPEKSGAPSGITFGVADQKATIKASIPATQTGEWVASTRTYKPNMNYAYMYAAKKQSKGTNPTPESTHVTLEFKPLVTAMEFSIVADNTFPITSALKKAELSSSFAKLAGTFTATVGTSGVEGNPGVSDGGDNLTINFPAGVVLSKTAATTFTFLALPVEQKDLTLRLTFENGESRSLVLKTSAGNISVGARKKLYIRSLGVVPELTYTFKVTGPGASAAISHSGGDFTYSVQSYCEYKGSSKIPVGWKVISYSMDNGLTWTTSRPAMLNSSTTVKDDTGSITAKNYNGNVTANTATVNWTGPTDVGENNSKNNAFDLSYRTIFGKTTSTRNTANCYVVGAPGWYKFPLVYGNAIKNGQPNTTAYATGNTRSHMLTNLVRHDGNAISNPYIKNNGFTANSAILCWQDFGNTSNSTVITDYSTDGDYMYFYVQPGARLKGGNALLAAAVGNTIVWSWHIWVIAPQDLYTVPVGGNQMLSVNLGWYNASIPSRTVLVRVQQNDSGEIREFDVHQETEGLFGGNVYYEWGRKDPMLGFSSDFSDMPQYGSRLFTTEKTKMSWRTTSHHIKEGWSEGDYLTLDGVNLDTKIGTAIQNPNVYYLGGGKESAPLYYERTYNALRVRWEYHQTYQDIDRDLPQYYFFRWQSTRYDNLWNADAYPGEENPSEEHLNCAVVKTVYDPSPVGFKVPNAGAFDALASGGIWNDRVLWYSISGERRGLSFPSTSLREYSSAVVRDGVDGKRIYLLTAGYTVDTSKADKRLSPVFFQYQGGVYVRATTGVDTYGMCVRPIAE